MKEIKFIKTAVGMFPTASDQWLMLICALAAFDKHIAWYVWTIFVIEKIFAMYSAAKYTREEKEGV